MLAATIASRPAVTLATGSEHAPVDLIEREEDDIGSENALVLENVPDMHITADVHPVEAFRIFSMALLGHAPEVPKDGAAEHVLLEAYVIAVRYKWVKLQDVIINRLRKRHVSNTIAFSEVSWIIKQLKNNVKSKIIRYLVTQVASDYSKDRRNYENTNPTYLEFMKNGNGKIGLLILDAIGQKAEQSVGKKRSATVAGTRGEKRRRETGPEADTADDEDEQGDGDSAS